MWVLYHCEVLKTGKSLRVSQLSRISLKMAKPKISLQIRKSHHSIWVFDTQTYCREHAKQTRSEIFGKWCQLPSKFHWIGLLISTELPSLMALFKPLPNIYSPHTYVTFFFFYFFSSSSKLLYCLFIFLRRMLKFQNWEENC